MKCQICGEISDVHVTEIRGDKKFHHFLCERHKNAWTEGSVQPLTAKEANQKMREEIESSDIDPAELSRLKEIIPELFNEPPDAGNND